MLPDGQVVIVNANWHSEKVNYNFLTSKIAPVCVYLEDIRSYDIFVSILLGLNLIKMDWANSFFYIYYHIFHTTGCSRLLSFFEELELLSAPNMQIYLVSCTVTRPIQTLSHILMFPGLHTRLYSRSVGAIWGSVSYPRLFQNTGILKREPNL